MEYLSEWLTLVFVFSFALIAPGPDFVMAVRNSVIFSRKAGLFTAFGFALGSCIHIFCAIMGIGILIAKSAALFTFIKFIGALYLLYIGVKALRSKGYKQPLDNGCSTKQSISAFQALCSGFITNLLNPKAALFFLALFTQMLNPEMPLSVQFLFGATCVLMVWIWFSIVTLVLTHEKIQGLFLNISKWIDRICGALMIALGIKLALSK